jgi:hypothetical protein
MEGGHVVGHVAVRDYWTRQWQQIDPSVTPVGLTPETDGRVRVAVHQTVKNLQGDVIADRMVDHVYTLRGGLISRMDIEESRT